MRTILTIKGKLILFALSISLLPIAVITTLYYHHAAHTLTGRIVTDLKAVAESRALHIQSFLETIKGRTENFSSDGFIRSCLEGIQSGDAPPQGSMATDLNKYLLINKKPLYRHISAIVIADPRGVVVSSTENKLIGRDFSQQEVFKQGMKAQYGESYIDQPQRSPDIDKNCIMVSAPVFVVQGNERIGVIINMYDLACLNEITTNRVGLGETGEAYLIDRSGLMLTESRFIADAPLKLTVDTESVKRIVRDVQDVSDIYNDYRGVAIVGVSRHIAQYGWVLMVEANKSEVFASLDRLFMIALIVGGLSAVVVICVGVASAVSAVKPMKELAYAADRFGAGELEYRVKAVGKDEIGVLAARFNAMAGEISRTMSAQKKAEDEVRREKEKYESLVNNIPDAVYSALPDEKATPLFVSHKWTVWTGYTPQEFSANPDTWIKSIHPEDRRNALKTYTEAIENKREYILEYRVVHKDTGNVYYLLDHGVPIRNKDGVIIRYDGIAADITERKRMEDVLWKTNRDLTSLIQTSPMAIVVYDCDTVVSLWNPTAERLFGWKSGEAVGKPLPIIPDVLRQEFFLTHHRQMQGDVRKGLEQRLLRKDGTFIDVSLWTAHIRDNTGRIIGIIAVYADITERKKAETELRRLSLVITQSINAVFITDTKGTIEYVNPMFEQMAGYTREEIVGKNARILAAEEAPEEKYRTLWDTLLSDKTWRGTFKNRRKDGQFYWVNSLITPIADEKGQVASFLAIQEDITERIQAEDRVRYFASFDTLTGLLNRTRFIEVLNEWIAHASVHKSIGGLLLVDIDKFRLMNDTYGHKVGDSLLKRMASALQNIISDIDTEYYKAAFREKEIMESILGRLAGDEYAIFLPSRSEDEAVKTAEEIRKRIEALRFEEVSGHVTVSIGVVAYPKHGATIHDLFSRIDAALCRAKEQGHNRSHLYRTEDRVLEKMHSRIEWKGRILSAVREDRFKPWFQPVFDLKENRVTHYEALARMYDEDGNVILPYAFIEIAEIFGLIHIIDRIIIEKTLLYQRELHRQGRQFFFSVNLSGKDIGDKDFLEFLRIKIAEICANPEQLIFEITETAAINEMNDAILFINGIKSMGCKISLDDFGVGFTSFKYLKELSVDYIKIDGSFVRKLTENQDDRLFVKSIADVARGMGIKTVAEFVENGEIVEILRVFGVDYAQGYFIGKPAPEVIAET